MRMVINALRGLYQNLNKTMTWVHVKDAVFFIHIGRYSIQKADI